MFKFIVLIAFVGLAATASLESDVQVKALDNDISPEGNFHYGYQLSYGVDVSTVGDAAVTKGSYQYVSPGGEPIRVEYIADLDGYHPTGAHLPIAPEIPEAIVRALAYNLAHPQTQEQILARKL